MNTTDQIEQRPPEFELIGKNYSFWGQEVEIGIDEAGRGPVLGPMVYGAAFWPAKDGNFSKDMKSKYGFADSKQLSEAQRERIFEKIKETQFQDIGFFATVLTAEYISNSMQAENGNGGKNLNKISHDTAIDLIKKVRDTLGFKVRRVYLDTVGDPKKYKQIIEHALGGTATEITVESKADDTYPVVSAASICAKVTRDHELRDFKFLECPPEGEEFNRKFGCGYPGDQATKAWLREHMDPVFGFPGLVRFSWKTSQTLLETNGSKLEWYDLPDPTAMNFKDQKKYEDMKAQREAIERNRLTMDEKRLKMNVATHRLNIQRNFDEF